MVAEVVFPNTIPPFFPTGAVAARPPHPRSTSCGWPGSAPTTGGSPLVRPHPAHGPGIGQMFLNDIDDTVADARWCHDQRPRGGSSSSPSPTTWSTSSHSSPSSTTRGGPCARQPACCEDPLGGGGEPDHARPPGRQAWIAEATFFSRRPLTHMLIGGAFERFPVLRFVRDRTGGLVGPRRAPAVDTVHRQMRTARHRRASVRPRPGAAPVPERVLRPQLLGRGELPSPSEAETRHAIGVDRFMWGSDYPHDEARTPTPGRASAALRRGPTRRAAPAPRGNAAACTASTSTSSAAGGVVAARRSKSSPSRTKACPRRIGARRS